MFAQIHYANTYTIARGPTSSLSGVWSPTIPYDHLHDDPIITLNMFNTDPNSVRYDARVKAGKASINGVSLADRAKAAAWSKQIIEFRTMKTVEAIQKALAAKK